MATRAYMTGLINGISDGGKTQANEMRQLLTTLMNESFKLYEVKELDINLTITPTFLTDNFDSSGRGTSDGFQGYAICNGNNGTRNRNGRVAIGYDPSFYSNIGGIGGSENAIVVSHSHDYNSINGVGKSVLGFDAVGDEQGASYFNATTTTTGSSGIGKNMQPYIVTLFIQRIS